MSALMLCNPQLPIAIELLYVDELSIRLRAIGLIYCLCQWRCVYGPEDVCAWR